MFKICEYLLVFSILENLTIAYKTFGKLNEDRYYRAFQLNDYQLLSEQQTQN